MRWFLSFLFLAIIFSACNKKQESLTESELQMLTLFELSVTDNLEDSDPDSARLLAQKTLKLRDKITDTSTIYNAFIQIGKTYAYQQAYDSGLAYYQKAYEFVKNGDNKARTAKALHWLGDVHIYMDNNNEGAACAIQAIKINRELGQLLPLATNYSLYAHTFNTNYQYDSSLAYFHLAEQLFDSLNDQARKATILSNIGDVYRSIDDYGNALSIMKEALNIHDSLDNIREVARIENTIGTIYMNLNIYDSAIYYFEQSIPNAKSVGYDFMALIAQFNLGKTYSLAGAYKRANTILEEVYQFCTENDIAEGQMRCLLYLGLNKLETGNFLKAESMLNEGLLMAEENENLDLQKEFLRALTRLSSETSGNSLLADYYKRLDQIEDSINIQELKIKVAETEAKYENLKKEEQIKTLAQKNSYYKERNQYLIIIFALLLITSFFALFLYRKRNQLLKQKHLLSEESNKLKQLSLEKSSLELKLKDDTIEQQNERIRQKSRELVIEALNRNRINEITHQLQEHMQPYILKLRTKKDQEAVREILFQAIALYKSKPFEEFEKLIGELHPDFFKTLRENYKELSPREIQLCGLIGLNLSTKDISLISHLSAASINSARHTIRKKMNLKPEQNLMSELLKFQ